MTARTCTVCGVAQLPLPPWVNVSEPWSPSLSGSASTFTAGAGSVVQAGGSGDFTQMALGWPVESKGPQRAQESYFTATTGTRLHASKAPLSAWVAAAVDGSDSPAVSEKTARRLRREAEATGLPAGWERLAALLAAPRGDAGEGAEGPLRGLSSGKRRILAMLRTRAGGAPSSLVAAETGLSLPHVRRCLRSLRSEGFVEDEAVSVMWGYRAQRVVVWRLAMGERTIAALPQIGWAEPAAEEPAEGVPGEFWWLFWSGACASGLRIPDHALHIADTLIGGPDPSARAWALEALPLSTLRELRAMTGYDSGEASNWLDFTIRERSERGDE